MQEEKEIRDLVQQVAEGHKNSKAAKERIQKFKQSIGKASLFHLFSMVSFSFSSISLTLHSERSLRAKTGAPLSSTG